MKTSEQTQDLLAALHAVRLAIPPITRNRDGQSKRTGQKYKYADLNALIDATDPVLLAHSLLLVQSLEDGEGGTLRISSTFFHVSSGQWMTSDVSVEKPDDMQNFGMVCTYLKRYAQQALLNISTEEDDDAGSLQGQGPRKVNKSMVSSHTRDNEVSPVVKQTSEAPSPRGTNNRPERLQGKPTAEELTHLMNLLNGVYKDKAIVEQHLRLVLEIPDGQATSPADFSKRVKLTITRERYARLEGDAVTYQLAQAIDDDVGLPAGPETPTLPQERTSVEGERTDSLNGQASTTEDASAGIPHDLTDAVTTTPPDDIPPFEVGADGFVTQAGVSLLVNRADAHGNKGLLRQLRGQSAGWTPEMYRDAWGKVAEKKSVKV